jgi:hydrogenase expression/formation protein HypC
MCLAIPGQILRVVDETPEARIAEVDFAGERKTVNLVFLPDAAVGDYIVVHAGFATDRVPEGEALEALAHFREIRRLRESAGTAAPSGPVSPGLLSSPER